MAETVRSPSPSSNWACLHRDLIDSILDRLILLSDLVRFSAVCKSWNCMVLNHYKEKRIQQINHQLPWLVVQPDRFIAAFKSWKRMVLNHYKEKRIQQINHQLPWLVVQPGEERGRDYSLYDVSSSKICNFKLQNPFPHREYRCCGSSHGWFFVWNGTALQMFNPISGTVFGLPPFNAEVFLEPKRVTLSRDPSTCLTSPFEVLACWSLSNEMAHWKSGDKFWSYSQYKYASRIQDFIFYKDRMLGIAENSPVSEPVLDLIGIDYNQTTGGGGGIKIKWIASTLDRGICEGGYLVETTKGDLLMVLQNFIPSDVDDYVDDYDDDLPFRVNKLIIGSNGDSVKIIPITNLDGESLFLGKNNQSISVLASNYPGCIPNSIYNSIYYGRVEVFNLTDGVSECFSPTPSIKIPVPPWIVPSMKLP